VDIDITADEYNEMEKDYQDQRQVNFRKAKYAKPDSDMVEEFLLFPGKEAAEKTIAATTQQGSIPQTFPLKQ
jgi:hypothetical protein